ncbi:hypothetical protein GOBAR_DD03764 [Gossypium barbadense]|nr:hypothetical protein GOBAR_DD03764 [Gossypium barbadense]
MGVVKLDDSPKTENSLPDHNGVNMIGGSMGRKIKEDIAEVKIPLRWIWRKIVERDEGAKSNVAGGHHFATKE